MNIFLFFILRNLCNVQHRYVSAQTLGREGLVGGSVHLDNPNDFGCLHQVVWRKRTDLWYLLCKLLVVT